MSSSRPNKTTLASIPKLFEAPCAYMFHLGLVEGSSKEEREIERWRGLLRRRTQPWNLQVPAPLYRLTSCHSHSSKLSMLHSLWVCEVLKNTSSLFMSLRRTPCGFKINFQAFFNRYFISRVSLLVIIKLTMFHLLWVCEEVLKNSIKNRIVILIIKGGRVFLLCNCNVYIFLDISFINNICTIQFLFN